MVTMRRTPAARQASTGIAVLVEAGEMQMGVGVEQVRRRGHDATESQGHRAGRAPRRRTVRRRAFAGKACLREKVR